MKKLLLVIVCVAFCFTLTACDNVRDIIDDIYDIDDTDDTDDADDTDDTDDADDTIDDFISSDATGIIYRLSEDGTYASVIGYDGKLEAVVIADIYQGVPVTSIGNEAFRFCSNLTSVTIPDSVTSIGNYAFYYCSSLTSVTIPDSVTSIGGSAFEHCFSLISVTVPDSVTSIGSSAFFGCNSALYTEYECGKYVGDENNPYAVLIEVTNKNLGTYTINENTKIIAYGVFDYFDRLTSIDIPDGVTSIGGWAFYDCTSLTSVTIGDSVTSIGDYAFSSCYSLTTINYKGTEEEWNAISKGLYWNSGTGNYTINYNYTE